jgi:hypothetical protein
MTEYTKEDFLAVVTAATIHKTTIWNKYSSLSILIDQAETLEELDQIQW